MSSLREADGEVSLLEGSRDVRRYSRVGDAGIGGGVGFRPTLTAPFPGWSGCLEEVPASGDCELRCGLLGDRGMRGGLMDGTEKGSGYGSTFPEKLRFDEADGGVTLLDRLRDS